MYRFERLRQSLSGTCDQARGGTTGLVEPDHSIGPGACEAARAVGVIQRVFGREQLKADIQVRGLI